MGYLRGTKMGGLLDLVNKYNDMKGSFANHAHTVIKTNGNFAVNHSLDFLKQLTSFGDKSDAQLDVEAQAYDMALSKGKLDLPKNKGASKKKVKALTDEQKDIEAQAYDMALTKTLKLK